MTCLYTPRLISIQPEGTFGRLRYRLGGDRPSQTARLTRSLTHARLDTEPRKSGISPLPPPTPRGWPHRLPPILRIRSPVPMPSCSKAPRGLFVLSRVTRIFTRISISPGPPLRQRPTRYSFRAGRNLPDKEFRYLRTVIVTAAVYWRFSSRLAPLPLTFQHWAGVSPHTSACALAETCVFVKQSVGPVHCASRQRPAARAGYQQEDPFSRSYGASLPSSLREVLPITLGRSPPPTCVGLRYGHHRASLRGFSCQFGLTRLGPGRPEPRIRVSALNGEVDLPISPAYALRRL